MKIVNPLYDKTFKYLMQNERMAKKVLSVILQEEIEELSLSQQETVVEDEKRHLTMFRLDFKATLRKASDEKQTVLIELQKSKYETDIQRFRTYLGANYIKSETEKSPDGKDLKVPYPIITIYILGYPLNDLPYLAVTVNRHVVNAINNEKIETESFFINHLTHRSHILQVRRLPEKRKTKLEQFLSLFNQAWCTDNKFILDLQEIPEEFRDMATYLQGPVMDEDFRRQLQAEEDIDTIFDNQEAKYLKQVEEAKQREEEERKQKDEERKQKDEERKQKEAAQQREKEAQQTISKIVKQLHVKGISISEIAAMTGKSESEIKTILG